MDVEDQQHLLGQSTQSRRAFGRPLTWAVAGLSAAAVAAVMWHGSSDTIMRSAATPDSFTALVKLNKAFGGIRKLADKTKAAVSGEDPAADKTKTELKDLACDLDKLDMEICGAEGATLETRCERSCVAGYRQMVAACPPNHQFAKSSKERLSACRHQLGGSGEKHAEEKEAEALSDELADDEQAAKAAKCLPLMLQMATTCKMDQAEPDLENICARDCQDAIEALQTTCSDLDGLGQMPLDSLSGMCGGCARSMFVIGQPNSKVQTACKAGASDPPEVCAEGCRPYMCDLLEKCPADQESGIPGMGKEDVNEMRGHITEEMKACACDAK